MQGEENMKKIKATSINNFLTIILLVFTSIFTFCLGLFCKKFIGGEDGRLLFYTMCVMLTFQVPTIIYLYTRFSKLKDIFITENEILLGDKFLCSKRDIKSIERKNFLLVDIKYLMNNEEKDCVIVISNSKLNEIKSLLSVYE